MMYSVKPKLVRITTVPVSLRILLKGQMKYMKQHGFEVVMISSPGDDAAIVEQQEECEMITIPMERKVNLFADLQSLFRLIRILKNLEPDIVHSHTPKAGLLGMLAAKLAGVPVRLHTVAGLPWMEAKGINRQILKFMERITAFASHKVYPNSKGLYDFLKKEKIVFNSDKLKLLGNGSSNGIDCNYYCKSNVNEFIVQEIKSKAGIKNEGWVWIFCGRIVKDKGISELLKAFLLIQENFENDQLWLVGEEEPLRDPINNSDKYLITQNKFIIQWGFQNDVRPFFAAADVLVFPSYREGLPNVPLQAGAMECASIVTDINGCNEIVVDAETGYLVTPKSVEDLYFKMKLLRTNPEMKKIFGVKSRERIKKLYDRGQMWELIKEEYEVLLNFKNL